MNSINIFHHIQPIIIRLLIQTIIQQILSKVLVYAVTMIRRKLKIRTDTSLLNNFIEHGFQMDLSIN